MFCLIQVTLEKKNTTLILPGNLFCFILKSQRDWTSNSAIKVYLRLIYRRMQLRWQRLSFWPIYKNRSFVKICIAETTQLPEVSHCPAYLFFVKIRNLQKVSSFFSTSWEVVVIINEWNSSILVEEADTSLDLEFRQRRCSYLWGNYLVHRHNSDNSISLRKVSKRSTKIPSVPRLLSTTPCCAVETIV